MIKLKENGFTLVEIMIVVAIIAILSAIAIPNFMTARSKSRANACRANLRQIDAGIEQVAMDSLKTDNDTCVMTDLVPTYIKKTPQCQAGGAYGATIPTGGFVPVGTLPGGAAWAVGFNDAGFIVGSTPWCDIGGTTRAGLYPHYLYLTQ